jgi:hypothetical protein
VGVGSGTTALIVGAVLVVLALLFHPDLEELGLSFRGGGFTYKRRREEELLDISETLTDVSQPEEGEPDSDVALQTLRANVQALAESIERQAVERPPRGAAAHVRDEWRSRWRGSWFEQGLEMSPTEPPEPNYFLVTDQERKYIHVSFLGWVHDWRIRCTVISPHQQVSSRVLFGQIGMGTIQFGVSYPTDFPAAPDLVPGEYEFRWSRVGKTAKEAPTLVDRFTLTADDLAGPNRRIEPRRELLQP